MAFSPNWIDPNNTSAASGAWQHFVISDAGSGTLYGLLDSTHGDLSVYVSTDDASTWSLLNATCPIHPADNYKLFSQFIGGKLRVGMAEVKEVRDSAIIKFSEYDVIGDSWSSITNIGGGFDPKSYGGIAAQGCTGILDFKRQDGSRIVVYQCENSAEDFWQVRILKYDGAWTELALLSNGPEYFILFSGGINPVTDVVDIFVNQPIGTVEDPSNYIEGNMLHYSVATNDTVSSEHLVEELQELMPAVANPGQAQDSTENGRVAYSADGLTIAFGYGYWTNTYPDGDHVEVSVRVAVGDLSGNPLNPSWNVETVGTFTPKRWNNGFSNDVNVTFMDEPVIYLEAFGSNGGGNTTWCGAARHTGAGAGLKAYWGSRVTAGVNNTSKLFWSLRTAPATWVVPAILFPDPDRDTIHMDGFDIPPPFSSPSIPLVLACPLNGTATVGTPYIGQVIVSGGTPPYTFEIL